MVANIKGVNSITHNELEESVGPILVLAIGFVQQMPSDMDIEMYKVRLGKGRHVEAQSDPRFDAARGKNGDLGVIQQMFCCGEFLPGHSVVNQNMGNLSMLLDSQYFGAPVNRHMLMRRELSPSDTINFVNTVLRRSYNGTSSMDDNDDDDDYLQEFSMDEIDEIGQNGDDQSNSFRYMTMEVPNTILRNQSQTLLSSIDKSP